MRSQTAELLGVQEPRVLVVPPGIVSTAGREAAELAEQSGLFLDPFQQMFVDLCEAELADGALAAALVKIICARQNGKNVGLEVVELYDLVISGLWIIHTAHLFTTTRESFGRLLALVEASPEIAERMTLKYASPMSGYEMQFRGGGRIRFIARSRTSGRGLSGDKLVFDEDQDLTDDAQGALLPTISAESESGFSQAIYLGSAPGPGAVVAHRLRNRGRYHDPTDERFAFMEISAAPDASLDDRDAWAQANPRLGRGMSEEFIAGERRTMSPELFARERMSISPEERETSRATVWPAGEWEAVCAASVAQPAAGLVFGLHVSPDRTRAAITVAGGGGSCGLVDERAGTGWSVDEVVRIAKAAGAPVAVLGKSPAGTLIADIERQGVTVNTIGQADAPVACGWFYDAVPERRVLVKRDARIDAAAAAAVKRFIGSDGAFVWDSRAGDVHVMWALTIAAWSAQAIPAAVEILF